MVKREWDEDCRRHVNLKVVLLGSSRLLLKRGMTESLAGRFELIRLGHWSLQEMRDAFGVTLDQYIYFGGYPGPAGMIDNEKRWRKYIKDSLVAPAIEKDVIMTSNIYKPALMKQLFELGCGYSAEILSLTKLMGQLQDAGNVTTLAAYLDILDECALLTGLQKYANDDARIMLAHLVLLVQSAHIAQDAEQQEEDGCKESAFAQRDAVGNQEQYQHQQGQNKQGDACPGPLAEAEQTGQAVEDVENYKVMLGCDAVNGLLASQLEVGLYVVVCWIELESTLKP